MRTALIVKLVNTNIPCMRNMNPLIFISVQISFGLESLVLQKFLSKFLPVSFHFVISNPILIYLSVSIPPSQASGNSKIKAYADSANAVSPKVEIPVSVQNNPSFLFWIIGIVVVAGIGTLLYFSKYVREVEKR